MRLSAGSPSTTNKQQMTRLLLVRHGETVDNVNRIMQGQTPGCLTLHGIEQAEAVARQMTSTPIDAFVSSDLKRAYDTCRIIAQPHFDGAEPQIEQTQLLRERDWGSFTGKFIPDLENVEWPDDVESLEHMKSRAQNFLTWIKTAYPGKVVLAVGHGIINKAIQSVYFKKPMNEIQKMHNAEVRILML